MLKVTILNEGACSASEIHSGVILPNEPYMSLEDAAKHIGLDSSYAVSHGRFRTGYSLKNKMKKPDTAIYISNFTSIYTYTSPKSFDDELWSNTCDEIEKLVLDCEAKQGLKFRPNFFFETMPGSAGGNYDLHVTDSKQFIRHLRNKTLPPKKPSWISMLLELLKN